MEDKIRKITEKITLPVAILLSSMFLIGFLGFSEWRANKINRECSDFAFRSSHETGTLQGQRDVYEFAFGLCMKSGGEKNLKDAVQGANK